MKLFPAPGTGELTRPSCWCSHGLRWPGQALCSSTVGEESHLGLFGHIGLFFGQTSGTGIATAVLGAPVHLSWVLGLGTVPSQVVPLQALSPNEPLPQAFFCNAAYFWRGGKEVDSFLSRNTAWQGQAADLPGSCEARARGWKLTEECRHSFSQ